MLNLITYGVIKNNLKIDQNNFKHFESQIAKIKSSQFWNKDQLVSLFKMMLPNFKHIEKDKYLDDKM